MNIKNLFTAQYLFSIDYFKFDKTDKFLLFAAAGFLILAVVFKIAAVLSPNPVDAKYREKFFNLFLFAGIMELIWSGARFENVKFFGSHFVAFIVLLIALIWAAFILADMAKNYKKEKMEWEKRQVRQRYLPN